MFLRIKDKILNLRKVISVQILDYEDYEKEEEEEKNKWYIRFTLDSYEHHDSEDFINKEEAEIFLDYITVQLEAVRTDHL